MASSGKGHRDGVEITAIGVLYIGPLEKKYWSSSRGKEKYPYPLGYQATRWHGGHCYYMEVSEGPRGPLFGVTCEEGIVCSGQTPSAPWEDILKKRHAGAKKILMRSSCASIDGPEMFGFTSPLVQRLCRDLVVSASGIAERSGVDIDENPKNGSPPEANVVQAESSGKSHGKVRKVKKLLKSISQNEIDMGLDKGDKSMKQIQTGKSSKQSGDQGRRRHEVEDISGHQKLKRISREVEGKLQDVEIKFIDSKEQMKSDLSIEVGAYPLFGTSEDEETPRQSTQTKRPRSVRYKGGSSPSQIADTLELDIDPGKSVLTPKSGPGHGSESIITVNVLPTRSKRLKGQGNFVEQTLKSPHPINSEQSTATDVDIVQDSPSPGPGKQEVATSTVATDEEGRGGSQNESSRSQTADTLDSASMDTALPKGNRVKKRLPKVSTKSQKMLGSVDFEKYGTNVDLTQSEGVLSIDLMCPSVDEIAKSGFRSTDVILHPAPKDSGSGTRQDGVILLLEACNMAGVKGVSNLNLGSAGRTEVDVKRKRPSTDEGSLLKMNSPDGMPNIVSKSQRLCSDDVKESTTLKSTPNIFHGYSDVAHTLTGETMQIVSNPLNTEASMVPQCTIEGTLPAESVQDLQLLPDVEIPITGTTPSAPEAKCNFVPKREEDLQQESGNIKISSDGPTQVTDSVHPADGGLKQATGSIQEQSHSGNVETTCKISTSRQNDIVVAILPTIQQAELMTDSNYHSPVPPCNHHLAFTISSATTTPVHESSMTVCVALKGEAIDINADADANGHLLPSFSTPKGHSNDSIEQVDVKEVGIALKPSAPDATVISTEELVEEIVLGSNHQYSSGVHVVTNVVPVNLERFGADEDNGVANQIPSVSMNPEIALATAANEECLGSFVFSGCVPVTEEPPGTPSESIIVSQELSLHLGSPPGVEVVSKSASGKAHVAESLPQMPSLAEGSPRQGVGVYESTIAPSSFEIAGTVNWTATTAPKLITKIDFPSLSELPLSDETASAINGTDEKLGSSASIDVTATTSPKLIIETDFPSLSEPCRVGSESVRDIETISGIKITEEKPFNQSAAIEMKSFDNGATGLKLTSDEGTGSKVACTIIEERNPDTLCPAVMGFPHAELRKDLALNIIDKLVPEILGEVPSCPVELLASLNAIAEQDTNSMVPVGCAPETVEITANLNAIAEEDPNSRVTVGSTPETVKLAASLNAIAEEDTNSRVTYDMNPETTNGADFSSLPVALTAGVEASNEVVRELISKAKVLPEQSSVGRVDVSALPVLPPAPFEVVSKSDTGVTGGVSFETSCVVSMRKDILDTVVGLGSTPEDDLITVLPQHKVDPLIDTLPVESGMNVTVEAVIEKTCKVEFSSLLGNDRENKCNVVPDFDGDHDLRISLSRSHVAEEAIEAKEASVGHLVSDTVFSQTELVQSNSTEIILPGIAFELVNDNKISTLLPVKETEANTEISLGNLDDQGPLIVISACEEVDLIKDAVAGEPMMETRQDDENPVRQTRDCDLIETASDPVIEISQGNQDVAVIFTNGISEDLEVAKLNTDGLNQDVTVITSDELPEELEVARLNMDGWNQNVAVMRRNGHSELEAARSNMDGLRHDFSVIPSNGFSEESEVGILNMNGLNVDVAVIPSSGRPEELEIAKLSMDELNQDDVVMCSDGLSEDVEVAKLNMDRLNSTISTAVERETEPEKLEQKVCENYPVNELEEMVSGEESGSRDILSGTEDWQMSNGIALHKETGQESDNFEQDNEVDDSATLGLEEYASIMKAGLENLSTFDSSLDFEEHDQVPEAAVASSQEVMLLESVDDFYDKQVDALTSSEELGEKDKPTQSIVTPFPPTAGPLFNNCISGKDSTLDMNERCLVYEESTNFHSTLDMNERNLVYEESTNFPSESVSVLSNEFVEAGKEKKDAMHLTEATSYGDRELLETKTSESVIHQNNDLEVSNRVTELRVENENHELSLAEIPNTICVKQVIVLPDFEDNQVGKSNIDGQCLNSENAEECQGPTEIHDLGIGKSVQPEIGDANASAVHLEEETPEAFQPAGLNSEATHLGTNSLSDRDVVEAQRLELKPGPDSKLSKDSSSLKGLPMFSDSHCSRNDSEDLQVFKNSHSCTVLKGNNADVISRLEQSLPVMEINTFQSLIHVHTSKLRETQDGDTRVKVNGCGILEDSSSCPTIISELDINSFNANKSQKPNALDYEGLLPTVKHLSNSRKMEPVASIDHCMPVSAMVLNVRGDVVRLCVVCGAAEDQERKILIYEVLYDLDRKIRSQLLSSVTCSFQIYCHGTSNLKIPMEEAALYFTPDGQQLLVLNSFQLPKECYLDTERHDEFGVNIVSFEKNILQVSGSLQSEDMMHCLTVPDPLLLVAGGDNGCVNCWELDSKWRTCKAKFSLPRATCNGVSLTSVVRLSVMSGLPHIIVGCDYGGSFALWDTSTRTVLSSWHLHNHYVVKGSLGKITSSNLEEQKVHRKCQYDSHPQITSRGSHSGLPCLLAMDSCKDESIFMDTENAVKSCGGRKEETVWNCKRVVLKSDDVSLGPDLPVRASAMTSLGLYLALGTLSGLVHVWEVATGKEICKLMEFKGSSVEVLATNPSAAVLAAANETGQVILYYEKDDLV